MMRDIIDELRKCAIPYVEIDGKRVALTEVIEDDHLRIKAIESLNARIKPYRNKDFPPEITTAWLTKIYLRAKDHPDERQTMVAEIRRDLIFGALKNPHSIIELLRRPHPEQSRPNSLSSKANYDPAARRGFPSFDSPPPNWSLFSSR